MTVIDVRDVTDVDNELLHVSLTADEVTRLFEVLGDDPIADHLEMEMRCQGKWDERPSLLAELEDGFDEAA
ncbi:MAG TPA: hypothetical protein VE985_00730 [Gaiellaceae bacterium]|nr:hypothetical protein [Gaiellaceae bacterium]